MKVEVSQETGESPGVWRIATLLAFGSLLASLDTSLINLGLNNIGDSLSAPLETTQWIHSGYLLALAASLPVCSWLSRRHGAGRLWTWALAAFTVSSGLCALSGSVEVLIAFRVLQGLAGGLLIPAGMTILGQVAGQGRMGRVIAVSTVPAILAPAAGPVLGALLISALSWHWLFLINVPIGVLGVLLARRTLPGGATEDPGRLDLLSLVLVSIGLPLAVYSTSELGGGCWTSWIGLIVGSLLLVAFAFRALHMDNPLVDLRLLRHRRFVAASAEVFFAGAALFGGLIVMPLYFQIQLGADVVASGLLLMSFSLGAAVTFPAAGWLTDRYGGGVVATVGLVITVVSTALTALLPADPNMVGLQALQAVRGVGLALAGSPGVSAALAAVKQREIPDASALINILSRVGGALASALFVVLLAKQVSGEGAAPAFQSAFWWLTGTAACALVAAIWLAIEQGRSSLAHQ